MAPNREKIRKYALQQCAVGLAVTALWLTSGGRRQDWLLWVVCFADFMTVAWLALWWIYSSPRRVAAVQGWARARRARSQQR